MLKTADELKKQAKKNNITFYPIHRCSITGTWCGYNINGDNVSYYDTAHNIPRDWEDLTNAYNANQPENNPKISQKSLDEENKIWKF